MSQSTPAKESRHERHLMRQRGAGSRAISTNFDFTFGLSAIAPVFATVPETAVEPPAKKRRFDNGNVIEQENIEPHLTQHPIEAAKPTATKPGKSVTKVKRRFPVSDEKAEPAPENTEDSFVATARSKKPRGRRKQDEPGSVDTVKAPAKGRPRRRAAADAGTTLQDGLVEKDSPLNERIRDEGRLNATQEGQQSVKAVAAHTFDAAMKEPKKAGARKPRATKSRVASKTRSNAAVSKDVEAHEGPDLADAAASKRQQRIKRRENEPVVEHADEALEVEELCVTEAGQSRPSVKQRSVAKKAASGSKRKVADAASFALDGRPQHDNQNALSINPPACESSPKRKPLAEADVNVARLSVSPAKADESIKLVPSQVDKPKARRKRVAVEVEPVNAKAVKQRKMAVEADEPVLNAHADGVKVVMDDDELVKSRAKLVQDFDQRTVRQNSELLPAKRPQPDMAMMPSPSLPSSATKATKKSTKQHDRAKLNAARRCDADTPASVHLGSSSQPESIRDTSNSTKSSGNAAAQKEQSKRRSKPSQEDEDVDWLFAPQEQVRQPKRLPTKTTTKPSISKKRTRHSDLTDVDLDDLVANIASLAPRKLKA